MPTLDWIGKKKVVNHHLDVPFKVLEKKYTYKDGRIISDYESENKIIHGDNLEVLKSLLPEYEGKIKCIYIDPPYNTGNENWIYNDNVNDPRMKKWINKVVGPEGEDLSRHDKWLCMMYPRLKLLQKLLSDDGALFISIDDNEYANLKLICDEIFGIDCFVSNISWQRTYSIRNDSKGIMNEVEHILCYSKKICWTPNRLKRTSEMDSKYKNPDNDPNGDWRNIVASAPGAQTHQGMVYAIQNPITGELCYPPQGRCWSLGQDLMLNAMNQWCEYELKDLNDEKQRAFVCGVNQRDVKNGVFGIVIKENLQEAREKAIKKYNGVIPEFYFSKKGYGALSRKAYIKKMNGRSVTNFWPFDETGHTDEASRQLKSIFEGKVVFDTPKPERLIQRIIEIATDKNSIVLDSFAGSGATAHAILNLNKEDNGNRRFILVELMDYAESITAERVKRVIKGYGEDKNLIQGIGGDFNYYELGEPILIDKLLNKKLSVSDIREYVWFSETHRKNNKLNNETYLRKYYLGKHNGNGYWFYYEKQQKTVLDLDFLKNVDSKCEQYIIYADICLLDLNFMNKNRIIFKKIPRDISKL